jgi:hypothetical protein
MEHKQEEPTYYTSEAHRAKQAIALFDRDKIDKCVAEKITEVNEESGYRPYFETCELVEIVASVIEEWVHSAKMEVKISKPSKKQRELQDLFKQRDEEAILCLTKEVEELYAKLDAWEKCADNLVEYAREFTATLKSWGKGYGRYDREIKEAEERIATYNKLKNEKESNE